MNNFNQEQYQGPVEYGYEKARNYISFPFRLEQVLKQPPNPDKLENQKSECQKNKCSKQKNMFNTECLEF